MNIIFVGHYRENSIEGTHSRAYLNCLLNSKHNIIARPIYLSNSPCGASPEIIEAENKQLEGTPDVVIQNVRPEFFAKTKYINIGICNFEGVHIDLKTEQQILLLDKLLLPTIREVKKIHNINVNTSVIGYPFERININKIEPLNIEDLSTTYNFYFIDEYGPKSNLLNLILAFNREFTIRDNVRLIIYSWVDNTNANDAITLVLNDIKAVKSNMRLYKKESSYMREIVMTPDMNQQIILSIHKACDCLVVPSRESSIHLQGLNAIMFNNSVLCTEKLDTQGLFRGYAKYIDSKETISQSNYNDSSSWESWLEPDLLDMQKKMRQEYTNGKVEREGQGDLFLLKYNSSEEVLRKIENAIHTFNN